MKGLKRYYIGFGALSVFLIGLLIVVLAQGVNYKKDKNVNDTAIEIADALNAHVRSEQEIPDDLSEAYEGDVPTEITYKKAGDYYTFCVSYSSNSGPNLEPASILFQGLSGSYSGGSYGSGGYGFKQSTLYISSYSWEEGETCYDVEPYIYQSSSYNSSSYGSGSSSESSSSSFDYLCEPSYDYYEFYEQDCVDGEYQL